ncbi:MAG: hypothetical protein JW931_05335 [Methanomicrobiaceae archaeon]|nr:hypothetical protein [Methanomicrobiaceae archaeon]
MYNLPSPQIEGEILAYIPFGDIVYYFSPYTLVLFIFALTFTALAILSRPEKQVDIAFGGDAYYTKEIPEKQMRFQRFMAISCGLATMAGVTTGDIFNFTLLTAMVGICNIGIVASVKNKHVLDNAYEYGILAMIGTLPLFGAAAIILATTGTLSLWEIFTPAVSVPVIAKALLVIGVIGEGMAPVYVAKAEITRAPGAPYVLMIHVSSLLMFLRVVEIIISM